MRRIRFVLALLMTTVVLPVGASILGAGEPPTIVMHAAGTVRLQVPSDWHVAEIPFRREIRLVISPTPSTLKDAAPDRGIWLSVHPLPENAARYDVALMSQWMPDRIRAAAGETVLDSQSKPLKFGNGRGIRTDFEITKPVPTAPRSGAHALESAGSDRRIPRDQITRSGFHVLISTDWSLVELHAVTDVDGRPEIRAELQFILDRLELNPPTTTRPPVQPSVQAASRILGSWKAYRSRLRLRPDGRIEIQPDHVSRSAATTGRTDESGETLSIEMTAEPIRGVFQAEQDLLRVEWQDGSLLNYRWRVDHGHLLLTDNDGQISQLRRILE